MEAGDIKYDLNAEDAALASDITTAPAVPSLWGMPLKYISCVACASTFHRPER